MKFGIKIMPREVLLDTQGRAVEASLNQHDLKVQNCRVGKYVEITVDEGDEQKALVQVKKMVDLVLCNPIIENFEITRLER
jgi:phosphoribosylformylglycinamidine synthase subunit PurS